MLVVYGTYGMDDVRRGEGVRRGYFGGAGGAAVQKAAFAEEGGPGGGVDGAVLEGRELSAGFGKRLFEGSVGK